MKIFKIIILNIFFITGITVNAQVIPVVKNYSVAKTSKKSNLKATEAVDTLSLPFFEDFSTSEIFPDQTKWEGYQVYVNNGYGINQPSVNVATFDAYDENGDIYNIERGKQGCDTLQSRPIDLTDAVDSIYLSFFYQYGGVDSFPYYSIDQGDTLSVDFFIPSTNSWYKVLSLTYDSAFHREFKGAFIEVPDSFKTEAFKFRFVHEMERLTNKIYAINAPWHVDYIVLEETKKEELFKYGDYAFYDRPEYIFNFNYLSIPWSHYQQAYYSIHKDSVAFQIRNLDMPNAISIPPYVYFFEKELYSGITDDEGNESYITDLTGQNKLNDSTLQFFINNVNINLPINQFGKNDSAFVVVDYFIEEDIELASNVISNDKYSQGYPCYDFYAYDDGVPEFIYPDNVTNDSKGLIILSKFFTFIPDTIRALDIFFASGYKNSSAKEFRIQVWSDDDDEPYELMYESESEFVNYDSTGRFTRWHLSNDNPIVVEDDFYIGIQQLGSNAMGIGLDVNHFADNIYVNIEGGPEPIWEKVNYGTLLMRPVMGKELKQGNSNVGGNKSSRLDFKIYPNPAQSVITLETNIVGDTQISIADMFGQVVLNNQNNFNIDISSIPVGIYVFTVKVNGLEATQKLIISR